MAIYVDGADLAQVVDVLQRGFARGVTCNPEILHRSSTDLAGLGALYEASVAAGAERVFAQATGTGAAELRMTAKRIQELGPRSIVKLPATRDGFQVAASLVDEGTEVLVTGLYAVHQALLAREVGARWVAPYHGRAVDVGRPSLDNIRRIAAVLSGSRTEVLAASVRSPQDAIDLTLAGAHHVTAAPSVVLAFADDSLSSEAAEHFESFAQTPAGS